MRRLIRSVAIYIALIQPTPGVVAEQYAFEAASIVPSDHGGPSTYRVAPSGIFYTNATLGDCILAAYQVSQFEVVGPQWLRTRRFDIVARTSGPASKEQLMLMLQTLLGERFGVRLHREPREMRAFALTVRRGDIRIGRFAIQPPGSACREDRLLGPDKCLPMAGIPDQRSPTNAFVRQQIDRKRLLPDLD